MERGIPKGSHRSPAHNALNKAPMTDDLKLTILENWGDVLAIDKPPGWLSIPGRGNKENIPVVSHVLGAQLRKEEGAEKVRGKDPDLYIVHRLDEGTSGSRIFAKTADAHKTRGERGENRK